MRKIINSLHAASRFIKSSDHYWADVECDLIRQALGLLQKTASGLTRRIGVSKQERVEHHFHTSNFGIQRHDAKFHPPDFSYQWATQKNIIKNQNRSGELEKIADKLCILSPLWSEVSFAALPVLLCTCTICFSIGNGTVQKETDRWYLPYRYVCEGNSNVVPLLKIIHCDCAVVTTYFDPLADKVDISSHTRMWVMLKWQMWQYMHGQGGCVRWWW